MLKIALFNIPNAKKGMADMQKRNRIVRWVLVGVGGLALLFGLQTIIKGQGDPVRLPCGFSLKDQVAHPRYGADMIFEITIKDSQLLGEQKTCKYDVLIDDTLLYNLSKYSMRSGTTAAKYSNADNIPVNLTIYDNFNNPAGVRGRKSPPPPCDTSGTRYLLFLHRLYIDDFIKTGMLHCRAAAYLRPISDREAVLGLIRQMP